MKSEQLPPGPKFGALQTIKYIKDTYAYYRNCRDRFGDLFTVPVIGQKMVVTGHPDGAEAIFRVEPSKIGVFEAETMVAFLGSNSVLLVRGEEHKRLRKLLMPPFHGARMRAYGESMWSTAINHAERWGIGQPFSMKRAFQEMSLEIILRTIFGLRNEEMVDNFRDGILDVLAKGKPSIVFFPFLRHNFFGLGPWAAFKKCQDELDAMMYGEIEDRRRTGYEGEDILSLMMTAKYDDGEGLSDDEIRDQLHTTVLAGHETTAMTLTWALYWLHRHPDLRERLLEELETVDPEADQEALMKLPYLDAVCNEVMRLYPIVLDIPRLVLEPFEVTGFEVPAGVAATIAIPLIHEREDLYPEPMTFRPERFLERTFTRFEFLPFGGGTRRCLGAAFATYEMKIILTALLRSYRFKLIDDRPLRPVLRNITSGPEGEVLFEVTERRQAATRRPTRTAEEAPAEQPVA